MMWLVYLSDLEAKAREWLVLFAGIPEHLAVERLATTLRSVAAEARKEALEEAARKVDEIGAKWRAKYNADKIENDDAGCSAVASDFLASRIRALAGAKGGDVTIKLTISNDEAETGRTVLVTKLAYEKGKHGERVIEQQHIQPGRSASFHIHLLTDLHIEELADYERKEGT